MAKKFILRYIIITECITRGQNPLLWLFEKENEFLKAQNDERKLVDENETFEYLRINADAGAFVIGVNMELNTALSNDITAQVGYTIQKSQYDSEQDWGDTDTNPDHKSKSFMRTHMQPSRF